LSNGQKICTCHGSNGRVTASMCKAHGGTDLCEHENRKDRCNTPPCKSTRVQPTAKRPKCEKCLRPKGTCKERANCAAYCLKHASRIALKLAQ
jgi:hypothetical protein